MRKSMWTVLGAAVALTVAPFAQADSSDNAQLRAELDAMKAELAQLKNEQGETWMNEKRAEEVKALVHEALSDADTRASLLQDGAMAGYDGKKFFLQSADGSFRLNIQGQIQFRYVFQRTRTDSQNSREENQGFQLRRAKIKFNGHIGDPKVKFAISLAGARGGSQDVDNGGVYVEEAKLSYDITDWLSVYGGRTKAPFMREELVSSSRQLAVERSVVNEYFTWGWTEGVGVVIKPVETVKIDIMVNDGRERGEGFSGTTLDYNDPSHVVSLTGRVEWLAIGDWSAVKGFNGWANDEVALLIGLAGGYSNGNGVGSSSLTSGTGVNLFSFTGDVSFKWKGLTAFAAGVGRIGTVDEPTGGSGEAYGAVAQVGYNISDTWEPFVRYEYLGYNHHAASASEDIHIVTGGLNWFIKKNAAKFTADVVYIFEPLPFSESGLGLTSSSTGDQIAFRLQFQLLF